MFGRPRCSNSSPANRLFPSRSDRAKRRRPGCQRWYPDLEPESAETFTGGVALQPSFAPGLSFSADYHRMGIQDAIAAPFTYLQIFSKFQMSG
jgi:hypothetical protein